jgi:hypothetical protein
MRIYITSVLVDDQAKALDFYAEKPSERPAAGPFKSALVNDGIPAASFKVDDLTKELDCASVAEPMDAGMVRMAVFDDTSGNLIQLIEMVAAS